MPFAGTLSLCFDIPHADASEAALPAPPGIGDMVKVCNTSATVRLCAVALEG